MKLWVHLEDGIVRGLMVADGRIPRDDLARGLGEWVLEGVTPILHDFGDGSAKVGVPLPPTPSTLL